MAGFEKSQGLDELAFLRWVEAIDELLTTKEQVAFLANEVGIICQLTMRGDSKIADLSLELMNQLAGHLERFGNRTYSGLQVPIEDLPHAAAHIRSLSPAMSELVNPFVVTPVMISARELYNRMRAHSLTARKGPGLLIRMFGSTPPAPKISEQENFKTLIAALELVFIACKVATERAKLQ